MIITPVKNSIDTFELTARSVVGASGVVVEDYIVYDDFSDSS